MITLDKFPRFRSSILKGPSLHILGLGFEDRCLAYPQQLRRTSGQHKFLCIAPSNDSVSWLLRSAREDNRQRLTELLPAVRISSINSIEDEIRGAEAFNNICLDISTIPRRTIFRVLTVLAGAAKPDTSIFVLYTYPRNYAYGPLEDPSSEINLVYDNPKLPRDSTIGALIMPGFDREYIDVTMAYMRGATGTAPEYRFMFGFPGRRYAFYERSLESSLTLIQESGLRLYPQDEIKLTVKKIAREIHAFNNAPVFVAPLGPRICCVAAFMAVRDARNKENFGVNLIVPGTRRYSSIRSDGIGDTLIEQIFLV